MVQIVSFLTRPLWNPFSYGYTVPTKLDERIYAKAIRFSICRSSIF
jgi:hypothetical protein